MKSYQVIWKTFGRYSNEKVFDNYESAKKFFYAIRKGRGVSSVELLTPTP